MNPNRKATPDSEAVASSEDERPWPAASAFGTLPRKENSVPGFGGGIWAQKRGNVKMDKTARNNAANAARDGRLNPTSAFPGGLRAGNTPSPAGSEGSGALPFAIPLYPTPKAGRSLSHSHGQRELVTTRQLGNEQSSILPLDLLSEENDTETDSEIGGTLTQTASQPPSKTFQRSSAYPVMYDAMRSPAETEDHGGGVGRLKAALRADRSLEGAFGHANAEQRQRRLWESHLGWDDLHQVNESRRHSLAEIPTRRGSLSAIGTSNLGGGLHWASGSDAFDYTPGRQGDYGEGSLYDSRSSTARGPSTDTASMKHGDKDEQSNAVDVPSMYKVPFIEIADHERSETDRRAAMNAGGASPFAQSGRPRKQLYIVSFKCSRVDVFYLLDNTGLFIKEGDIVIVEADRGQDLGTVQHANVSNDEARLYKRKYGEEQYKWLMMFSRNNNHGSVNPNAQAQFYGENQAARTNLLTNAPPSMQGLPRDSFNNLKPKAIKRLASGHEIRMLGEKEGNEAKAKRTCQQKVNHLHLDMEILDAEWQWDFQKLIFYYYADHYINFKDLITELYRIYKTRIWLSAINPASFSQHAHGQPPSGIGPGAITSVSSQTPSTNYTMAYGSDPDPYGAIPPYSIGYDTYTPNYPGIPGVANSFAPHMYQQQAAPSLPPGVAPTGSLEDYNYFYDRSAVDEHGGATRLPHIPAPYSPLPYAGNDEYPGAYRGNIGPNQGMHMGHPAMHSHAAHSPMGAPIGINPRGGPQAESSGVGLNLGLGGGLAFGMEVGDRRSFAHRVGAGVDSPSPGQGSRPSGPGVGMLQHGMRTAVSRPPPSHSAQPEVLHNYLQNLTLHGENQANVAAQARPQ